MISISEGAEGSLDASGETEVFFRPNKKQGPSTRFPIAMLQRSVMANTPDAG